MPNGCYRHSMPFLALATPKNECLVPHSRHSSTLYSSQVRCSCTVAWFPMFHFHTFHFTVLSLQIPMISTSMWFANCQLSRFLNASKWRPRSLFPPPRLLLVVGFLRPFCARGMDPARPARQDMRWFLISRRWLKANSYGTRSFNLYVSLSYLLNPQNLPKTLGFYMFLLTGTLLAWGSCSNFGLLGWPAGRWLAGWPAGMSYWMTRISWRGWWKNPTRQQVNRLI